LCWGWRRRIWWWGDRPQLKEARKQRFFEKKRAKIFLIHLHRACFTTRDQIRKGFLVTFFQKSNCFLASILSSHGPARAAAWLA
jgi:hypothetical protein